MVKVGTSECGKSGWSGGRWGIQTSLLDGDGIGATSHERVRKEGRKGKLALSHIFHLESSSLLFRESFLSCLLLLFLVTLRPFLLLPVPSFSFSFLLARVSLSWSGCVVCERNNEPIRVESSNRKRAAFPSFAFSTFLSLSSFIKFLIHPSLSFSVSLLYFFLGFFLSFLSAISSSFGKNDFVFFK